jgi:hypothetical protein
MNKIFPHIALSFFLSLFFFKASAQDSIEFPPPVEMADTVYETPASTTYHFKETDGANKVDVRTVPESDLKRVKSDDDYWYANLTPPREKKEPEPAKRPVSIFDKAWFNTLFWIVLIGGFLALLIWFLATSNISLFRRKIKTADTGHSAETETENIFEINFEKEIQKAIDAANFRLAVRLMYLRTLKDLSVQGIINYTHEKTNSDYLFQLAASPHYKKFFRLTRDFDYTWYGHFPLSQESFSMIRNDFNSFKQQLS